eukprot:gene2203-3395_t
MYIGIGGVALALDRCERNEQSITLPADLADRVKQLLRSLMSSVEQKDLSGTSFLLGAAGPLAFAATYHFRVGNREQARDRLQRLIGLGDTVLQMELGECELLYGRAGYLNALSHVQALVQSMGDGHALQGDFRRVAVAVIHQVAQSGLQLSQRLRGMGKNVPTLAYIWYGDMYLGAAHGIAGILYVLLDFPADLLNEAHPSLIPAVRATLEELMQMVHASGNYPAVLGADSRLLQFCHGAPGFAMLYCKAYQRYGEPSFLRAALGAADATKAGIRTKGAGLCHGPPGSIYALLHVYRVTKDISWLRCSASLAMYSCRKLESYYEWSDHTLSLYEGVAGLVVLIVDMLSNPSDVSFPGFDA